MKKSIKDPVEPKAIQAKPAGIPVHRGYGILMLFVVVSILYANYVVYFGTEGLIPKLMLVPSTLFVGGFLVYKALK